MNAPPAQLQVSNFHARGLIPAEIAAGRQLLGAIYPLNCVRAMTGKGKLGAVPITSAVSASLLRLGFAKATPVALSGSTFSLEADFIGPVAAPIGTIYAELQLGARESVPYDYLKHAEIQRL